MARGDILVDRCPSGIPGFDDLCNGGFVRSSVNALMGGPGAGKTIFLLQFLYTGATEFKENGLYISFEPDIYELYKDALVFGWDFQKLEQKGQFAFMKIAPTTDVRELQKELTKLISKYDIKRICFDPISFFGASQENEAKTRLVLFELTALLKRLGATVILANETAVGDAEEVGMAATDVRSQYIKFLVDGLIDMYSSGLGGVSDRAVRISKMRRTNHSRGPQPMQISESGMKVLASKGKKGLL
ncbi:AAA family ATPase [Candidatus Pacearchaeota archaeon]|nr:AAA family ATPase [Candidatus Pacearchaeota archaeon]